MFPYLLLCGPAHSLNNLENNISSIYVHVIEFARNTIKPNAVQVFEVIARISKYTDFAGSVKSFQYSYFGVITLKSYMAKRVWCSILTYKNPLKDVYILR